MQTLIAAPWTDARARLLDVIDLLAIATAAERRAMLLQLEEAKPDTAPALWLVEEALSGRSLPELAAQLRDDGWADRMALSMAEAATVGVISMGAATRDVVHGLSTLRSEPPVVVAPSSVISRGLDDLDVMTEIGPPGDATWCLIPVAGWGEQRFWTTSTGAEIVRGHPETCLILKDPICHLGPRGLARFRPAGWLVSVETPG